MKKIYFWLVIIICIMSLNALVSDVSANLVPDVAVNNESFCITNINDVININTNKRSCNIIWDDEIFSDFFSGSSEKYNKYPYGIDENGICYYDYGSNYGNLGKYHNPTFVAAYANALYKEYLINKDNRKKDAFLAQVNFLINNAVIDGEDAFWTYPFEMPAFCCPAGWYSAMTSGRILGLLARAHKVSNNEYYLTFAQKVFHKLSMPRENGGMTTYTEKNKAWLEEDTYFGAPSFKVLNGHIFALSGLYDYALYTNSTEAKLLTQKCFNALLSDIDKFDEGYLSLYCQYMPKKEKAFAAPRDYHSIHIMQLLWLYSKTEEIKFLIKAMRFQLYDQFCPKIETNSSVNEKTNGPDKMNLSFGNNYWSTSKFPVTITIDCKKIIDSNSITLLGHSKDTAPKAEFNIYGSTDGKSYSKIKGIDVNGGQYLTRLIKGKYRFFIIELNSATEKGLVALDGIGISQVKEKVYPIFISHISKGQGFTNYNLIMDRVTDKNEETSIKVSGSIKTELIVPNEGSVSLSVKELTSNALNGIKVFASNNCEKWTEEKFSVKNDKVKVYSRNKYIKFVFDQNSDYELNNLVW